jgi:hypothetical protein
MHFPGFRSIATQTPFPGIAALGKKQDALALRPLLGFVLAGCSGLRGRRRVGVFGSRCQGLPLREMRTCTGLSLHIFHPKTDAYTIANSPQLGTCTGTKITPFPNANLVAVSLIFISPPPPPVPTRPRESIPFASLTNKPPCAAWEPATAPRPPPQRRHYASYPRGGAAARAPPRRTAARPRPVAIAAGWAGALSAPTAIPMGAPGGSSCVSPGAATFWRPAAPSCMARVPRSNLSCV